MHEHSWVMTSPTIPFGHIKKHILISLIIKVSEGQEDTQVLYAVFFKGAESGQSVSHS